jgi:hypothetical protein
MASHGFVLSDQSARAQFTQPRPCVLLPWSAAEPRPFEVAQLEVMQLDLVQLEVVQLEVVQHSIRALMRSHPRACRKATTPKTRNRRPLRR